MRRFWRRMLTPLSWAASAVLMRAITRWPVVVLTHAAAFAHECGHIIAAQRQGWRWRGPVAAPVGIAVWAWVDVEVPSSASDEQRASIARGGPAATLGFLLGSMPLWPFLGKAAVISAVVVGLVEFAALKR